MWLGCSTVQIADTKDKTTTGEEEKKERANMVSHLGVTNYTEIQCQKIE